MSGGFGSGVCDGHHDDKPCHVTVGDESLTTVQNPVVAILFGVGANPLEVTGRSKVTGQIQ